MSKKHQAYAEAVRRQKIERYKVGVLVGRREKIEHVSDRLNEAIDKALERLHKSHNETKEAYAEYIKELKEEEGDFT